MAGSRKWVWIAQICDVPAGGFRQFGLLLLRSGQIIKQEGEIAVSP
jgi:hypothetical protein